MLRTITAGKYNAGLPSLLRNKLEGICMRMYPTNRIETDVSYWELVMLRSACMPTLPDRRAVAMLFRSR